MLAFSNTFYIWFILGITIADLYANNPKKIMDRIEKINPLFKILAMALPVALAFYPNNRLYSELSYFKYLTVFHNDLTYSRIFLHFVSLSLIFLIVLTTPRIQKILSIGPLVFLGKTSFSVYVIHFVLVTGLTTGFLSRAQKELDYTMAVILTSVGMLIMIYALGYVLHRTVDQFSLDLSEKVAKKLNESSGKFEANIK